MRLMAHRRVAAVVRTRILVLEAQTCHTPLDILDHFSALDVPCHNIVAALLLHVCDSILQRMR